ncbi:hypothetical protein [Geobacter benzoatilyticus]|jgi:hypothetical protein|uniref:Uncharacterized protein n=1 Tax=Geobacter benzoatilyticus TaxID=2815309 RepID=A0ABX7Q0M4_9BACT|nr:hypothetical protein [Geobacter benzoatilyticus]QSV44951.1 hypothetical protein JZM60_12440 [Geobacter benzoatilyticus]
MNILNWDITIAGLSELDRQIEKLRTLRDSYREANIAYYGKEIADMLNS